MKTLSDKQLAANRANAAKSTGPRTPDGKTRAAANSRKHGLAAASFTVTGLEDRDTLDNLIADAVACYRPQDAQEQFAVERIALAQLAILRAYRLEAGALASAFQAGGKLVTGTALGREYYGPDAHALAEGFHLMAGDGKSFALLLRYQSQADRQYRRAVEDLERLQSQKDVSPNEPICEQPEPLQSDTPSPAEDGPEPPATEGGAPSPAPGPRPPAPFPAPATIVPCSPSTASSRL